MNIQKSIDYYQQATRLLPGGVDSPVRAFRSVGGQPIFIERGEGPYLYDVDGNKYIDYVLSWGPLVLGHAYPEVVSALKKAVESGTSYGAPSPLEIELAIEIQELMPNLEMMRFVNSGTEATMSALRLARAFTQRDKIIKFEGCYHGHADLLLVQAGSGVATLGLPDSPGVPSATVQDTLVARYNDLDSVTNLFTRYPGQIAGLIVEAVAGNMGVVPPVNGFLEGLSALCNEHGSLLIFDEVMTGFRVDLHGAQGLYGIKPDLTTLGKVIGGGLPVGAYGGRKDIMNLIAPSGPVYQAGTLAGNPLAMTAGIITLQTLKQPGVWTRLEAAAQKLTAGIGKAADKASIPHHSTRVGTMFSLFFTDEPIVDWQSVKTSRTEQFIQYFKAMLGQGIYLAPSQFEAGFLSSAHDDYVIEQTIHAAEQALKILEIEPANR